MNLSAAAVEAAVLAFHRDNLWESALEAAYAIDSKTSDEEQRQLLDTVVRCNATIERLRAENEKLRAALKDCADDLEAEIRGRYTGGGGWDIHPSLIKKFERDMSTVRAAAAALKDKSDG